MKKLSFAAIVITALLLGNTAMAGDRHHRDGYSRDRHDYRQDYRHDHGRKHGHWKSERHHHSYHGPRYVAPRYYGPRPVYYAPAYYAPTYYERVHYPAPRYYGNGVHGTISVDF